MDDDSDILRATLPINSTMLIVRFLRGPTPLLCGWPVVARLAGTREAVALRAVDDFRAVDDLRTVDGLRAVEDFRAVDDLPAVDGLPVVEDLRAEDDLRFTDLVVSFALI